MAPFASLSDQFYMSSFETYFGWMRPVSNGSSIIRLDWNQSGWCEKDHSDHVSRETKSQLQAFFCGRLYQFKLPLSPIGKSNCGLQWLNALVKIPYGTVISYAEFAEFAGKPGAARTAGSTCAKNPIPIIYPCHRVIRMDKTLGNYSGGGGSFSSDADNLARKSKLLDLESYWANTNA